MASQWDLTVSDPIEEEDRKIRQAQSFRAAQGDPNLARRVAQFHHQHGYLKPGQKYALAQIGAFNAPTVRPAIAAGQRLAARRGWFDLSKLMEPVKGVTRSFLITAAAPFEELQGQFRAAARAAADPDKNYLDYAKEEFGDSLAGLALKKELRGERPDLGTGFMPGGEILEEYRKAPLQYPSSYADDPRLAPLLGRKNTEGTITLGQEVFKEVLDPGSKAFDIAVGLTDFAAALFLDPVGKAGKVLSRAGAAARRFDELPEAIPALNEIGAVRGLRKGVLGVPFQKWLTGPGRVVVDKLAEMSTFDEVWRATSKKLPVDVALQIADTPDRNAVEGILRGAAGVVIRDQPRVEQLPVQFRKKLDSVRLFRNMPHSVIDTGNLDEAVMQVDRLGAMTKMGPEKMAHYTERMARSGGDTSVALGVVTDMMSDVDGLLKKTLGWDADKADKFTAMFAQSHESIRAFAVDEIGRNMEVVGAKLNPETGMWSASPHLEVEYINRVIPLPPLRDLRKATGKYPNLLTHPAVEIPTALYGGLIESAWKPLLLLRPAWPLRVISELQLRMTGMGLDSLVSTHPVSAIMWILRREGIVDDVGQITPAMIEEDFMKAMPTGSVGQRDVDRLGKVRTGNYVPYDKGKAGYVRAWGDTIKKYSSSQLAREVAKRYDDPQAARDWFNHGPGQKLRQEMARAPGKEDLNTIAGANLTVDAAHRRIAIATGGNRDLIDAIITQKFRGKPLHDMAWAEGRFEKALREIVDFGPPRIVADQLVEIGASQSTLSRGLDMAGHLTERLMHGLMAVPESKLARSPAWKQFYWKRATELMPYMEPEAQKAFINVARTQKLPKRIIQQMERRAVPLGRVPTDVPLSQFEKASAKLGREISGDQWGISYLNHHKPQPASLDMEAAWLRHVGELSEGKFDPTALEELGSLYAADSAGLAKLHAALKQIGTPDEVLLWRAVRPGSPGKRGRYGNATTSRNVAEEFAAGSGGQVVPIVVPREAILGLGHTKEMEVIFRMADATVGEAGATSIKLLRRPAGLTVAEATDVAKGHALDDSLKLLYNFHEKSQFADMFRFIFPFGEAFKEVTTSWQRITTHNPMLAHRAGQAIQGARESGWFQHDETSGQEMFVYPGSTFVTEKLLGVPVPLRGAVAGLNIIGTVIPGFGPAVQVPASWFLPDTPSWEGVRKTILPFGEVEDTGGILESQLPGYMKRFLTAWQTDKPANVRAIANTTFDIAKHLAVTGEYDTRDPDDIDRMLDDARGKARWLFIIRGLSQFVAPSAPRPQAALRDKTGKLLVIDMLSKEYRKIADEDGHDAALATFVDKYGEEIRFVFQAKSYDAIAGLPTDAEGLKWIKANPEIVRRFPNTYGLFAPKGGEFSFEAYQRYLRSGEKQQLTPQQMVRRANNTLAQMAYRQARKLTKDPEKLRQIREVLTREYPGFQDETGIVNRAKPATVVAELEAAAQDPTLAKTEAGEALNIYLRGREQAMALARKRKFVHFGQAKSMAPTRRKLRALADALIEDYPDFQIMWERGLSREMKSEDEDV